MRNLISTIMSSASAASNQTTKAIDATSTFACSLQVVTTGTAVGTVKLQASNDLLNPANWSDIPSATVSVSGAGAVLIPKTDIAYAWIRGVYTFTSGTGNISMSLKTDAF